MMTLIPYNRTINQADGFSDLDLALDSLLRDSFVSASTLPIKFKETKDNYRYSFDMPGIDKDSLKLTAEKGVLTIEGFREDWTAQDPKHEDSKFRLKQSIALPETARADNIEANYRDGVLYLHIQKREEAKPQVISVKVK
jgi:HSP20 family protein